MTGRPPSLLQRSALGLWFLVLGALGLVRVYLRYVRDAQAAGDTVMQLWLVGSLLVLAFGVWLLVRALSAHRNGPRR